MVARRNAARTLEKPVPLSDLRDVTPAQEYARLEAQCHDGQAFAWGVKDERWPVFEKMISNPCVVLFRRDQHVFKVGQIRGFTISPRLADLLWERDDYDEPWSNIYFLDTAVDVTIPISEVHAEIGRQLDSHWQALWTLKRRPSGRVIDLVRAHLRKPPRFAAN
jgi:hypothetical protein